MDHVTAEQDNVVERYLLGQLAEDEAADFEAHFLDCSECLEQLELSRRLHRGLKDMVAEDGAALTRLSVVAWLLRRGRALPTMLAMLVLIAAVLPWAWLTPRMARLSSEHKALKGELSRALAPQLGSSTYILSPERSGTGQEPSTVIRIGPTPKWVTLALEPPPATEQVSYRIRFGEGEELWQSDPAEANADGRVTFTVHSSQLTKSRQVVELHTIGPEGDFRSSTRFSFRVER